MINIRRNIFETNSSSNHNLTIIPDYIYEKWRNHEITLKIIYNYERSLDSGDAGFMGTWGNFFLEQGKLEISDISSTREKNIEELEKAAARLQKVSTEESFNKYLSDLYEYKVSGKIGEYIYIFVGSSFLFLTPEEYAEYLKYQNIDSPFLYKGSDVVVIGYYYRS